MHSKKITKESLENKEYKWEHSTHRGFFIGMKLTLALEYPTLKPLAFLINEANVSEPKIYPEMLKELKRKRIIVAGDIVYADRGYYSYENYVISVREFKVIPLIFPRKKLQFQETFQYSHGRLRIPHFRRIKNPQFSILEKGSRIVSNAENGGMAIDTRFVFTRPEH